MVTGTTLEEGQVITGPMFNEPMRVVITRPNGPDSVEAGLVGLETSGFRNVTLTASDIANLKITDPHPTYDGDGNLIRLGLQAYSMGIAHEFDPYFGLSISKVDPLPHQLEAVYEYFMKLPSVRFLLADDAGAGKTIMAGLLIRELKLRGLAERILVVCPANLTFQWQREMFEKFDQQFHVLRGSNIRDQFGMNQWLDNNQVITSLDLAKREDILAGLRQATWDLVIIDEAHRMSASDESHKSQRYRLGELLRDSADNILLMTATPHKGDPRNFTLFLQLLDQDAYADVKSIRRSDGPQTSALLSPAYEGGNGLFPGTTGERGMGHHAGLHQAHPQDGRLQHRRRRTEAVQGRHGLREAPEPESCRPGRRPEGARHRVPDVHVPETACFQHSLNEEVPGKPGQKA